MMTSYFNLLKYAQTGIASPDMTYFDKLRASTLIGGAVKTLTGIPPLSFKADGKPLISWSMKGNGVQSGTPTPDNPVMPEFVGVRTGNWLSEKYENRSINGVGAFTIDSNYDLWLGEVNPGETYTISNMDAVYGFFNAKPHPNTGATYDGTRGYKISGTAVVTIPAGCTWIAVRVLHNADNAMLNSGSTALPYEPYGWAEKITCAGQTTPVYLGQVSTVRKIRKLVLTGQENFGKYSQGDDDWLYYNALGSANRAAVTTAICTHAVYQSYTSQGSNPYVRISDTKSSLLLNLGTAIGNNNIESFKAYLAAQYAAGTPVTVWYVLSNEQTGIVNEPLCKIGDYADELHSEDAGVTIPTVKGANVLTVDTPIQPSEMTITFKG